MYTVYSDDQIPIGGEIIGSDGKTVGRLSSIDESCLILRRELFRKTDLYIHQISIKEIVGNKIFLNITKNQALGKD